MHATPPRVLIPNFVPHAGKGVGFHVGAEWESGREPRAAVNRATASFAGSDAGQSTNPCDLEQPCLATTAWQTKCSGKTTTSVIGRMDQAGEEIGDDLWSVRGSVAPAAVDQLWTGPPAASLSLIA